MINLENLDLNLYERKASFDLPKGGRIDFDWDTSERRLLGFDWENLQDVAPLGPGDTNYWYDNIDDGDRLRLVDAIINVDSPFFNLKLLRTLVKEYYTTKIENAWWKGMGYKEGKLELMRFKRDKLNEARFKKEKTEAAKDGMLEFLFDGKMYPTGMTKAKVKKQEEEAKKANEKANPGLNQ